MTRNSQPQCPTRRSPSRSCGKTLAWPASLRAVAEGYADRPALGQRAAVVAMSDGGRRVLEFEPRFETVTYGQLWRRASGLAAVLTEDGLLAGERIATLGLASVDYTAIDMAVALLGCVSVPLHTGAPVSVLATMVEEAEPSVIACSAAYIADGVRLALSSAGPARLIVFDYRPDVDNDREGLDMARARIAGADSAVQLDVLDELLERGYALPPTDVTTPDDSQLAAIVYTSGSSGKPKGAMLTAGLVRRGVVARFGDDGATRHCDSVDHVELPPDEPHRGPQHAVCHVR